MKLDYRSSSLVISGGWNPNIINPYWIEKNLLGNVDPNIANREDVIVDVPMTTTSSLRYAPIMISFKDIKIVFTNDKLDFSLLKGDDFGLLEDYALKICDCLPYTPVTAYGVNFVFTEEKISVELGNFIKTIQSKKFDTPLIFEQYSFGFKLDDIITNINIRVDNKENISSFQFNFHFKIADLSQFSSGISDKSMHTLKEKAVKNISEIYGLELEV